MAPVKIQENPWWPRRRPLGGLEEAAGRPRGGRWAAGREAGAFPPGDGFSPPEAAVGGTTLVAQNGSKRTENGCFPEGAGPAPRPDSQPTWSTSIGAVGAGLG